MDLQEMAAVSHIPDAAIQPSSPLSFIIHFSIVVSSPVLTHFVEQV